VHCHDDESVTHEISRFGTSLSPAQLPFQATNRPSDKGAVEHAVGRRAGITAIGA